VQQMKSTTPAFELQYCRVKNNLIFFVNDVDFDEAIKQAYWRCKLQSLLP